MAHYWVPTSAKRELPRFAVRGGNDRCGKPSYVGRCYHEGNLLPAECDNATAAVSWAGKCHIKDEYEILVGPGYGWAPCQYGGVPRNAVSSGNCNKGGTLYIGRGNYDANDNLYVGRVDSSNNCLYVPSENQEEIRLNNYEVLVQAPADNWLPTGLDSSPPDAVFAGNESDGTAIYVARAMHDGVLLPAKFVPDRGEAYVVSAGCQSRRTQEIEVLCGPNYTWLQPYNNHLPASAVFTGRIHDGTPLIVGRTKYKGSLTPGLVSANGNCVIIPFGEAAVRMEDYEVLIQHHP